jgi:acetylornithine deacetylase/succinyl-diaminopimelate desuccinylase-like protein
VFAPGIGDNGRGLAALLALASVLDGRTVRTHAPVRFVATTGEEGSGDLRGAKHHFSQRGAAAVVALDGTGDSAIVHRAVGSRRYRVTIDGPGGHSWSDFGVANPLHAAGAAIANLASVRLPSAREATLSVTRASGGLSVNSIPARAWFEIDVRATAAPVLDDLDATLRRIVNAAVVGINAGRRAASGALAFEIVDIGNRPCGELPHAEPLVATAVEATRLIGRIPELATASTDANVPLALGIPAIAIGGGGRGGDVHTTGEWYENADGVLGIARALTVVVAAAGRA